MKQKSCHNCCHWQKVDLRVVLWEVAPPPEYECGIWEEIYKQLPDPQAVIDAAYVSSTAKAQEIAAQCPSFRMTARV